MKFESFKRVLLGAAAAAAVTGVAAVAAVEYQAGWDFDPSGTNRALNVNQVVFPDDNGKTTGRTDDDTNNSELWQKDNAAEEQNAPQTNDKADYLFEDRQAADTGNPAQEPETPAADTPNRGTVTGPQAVTAQTAALNTNNNPTGSGTADTVYDLTGDSANADMIIGGGNGTGNATAPGNGTGAGTENPQPSAAPSPRPTAAPGTTEPTTPTGTPMPTESATPTTPPTEKPTQPAEPPADPEVPPAETNNSGITGLITIPFDENAVAKISEENRRVVLAALNSTTYNFYTGQQLNIRTIFDLMRMSVRDRKTMVEYKWSWEQYNTYVKINRISFDGGKTWTDKFPVTVPENVGADDMKVEVSYRLKADDKWTTDTVEYFSVKESRVLVLDRRLDGNTTVLDNSWLLQGAVDTYPAVGSNLGLYGYTEQYWKQALDGIPTDKFLTQLFPGWTENGKLLPWNYTVTSGRHLLEPAESIPIDKNIYGVELKHYWITDDYVATILGDGSYGALQTLTYYAGADSKDALGAEYAEHLAVPAYIQAVDMPYTPYVSVGYLDLPDTVFYVNTDGAGNNCGLQVTKGYTVAAENPRYTAQDGMLYNKAKTEILGVPTGRTSLTVGEKINTVKLPYNSRLKSLTLTADSLNKLPEINFEQMADGGTIYLHDGLVDAFLLQYRTRLNDRNLHVSSIENNTRSYTVQGDSAITADGTLYKALATATRQLKMPADITLLAKGSLQYLTNLDTLLLPETGETVEFADGWADGATLTRIGCYTEEQYNAALAAAPDGVEVVLTQTVDAYTYMMRNGDVELISAPADIVVFDGTVPTMSGEPVAVTAIGDGALKDCKTLAWVDLPQETTTIGYQAFKGCTALQGTLMDTTDTIVVEEGAFDGCTALRFVASNAMFGDIRDENFGLVTSNGNGMLYRPTNSEGYNDNWTYFTVESGVGSYDLVDCGGTMALFGCSESDGDWLMLRSGATVDGTMTLPTTVEEIFVEAVQGVHAADGGAFQVNFDELRNLNWIDGSAFAESDIGNVITLPIDIVLGDSVFKNCHKLTEITLPAFWYGIALDWGVFTGCENLTKATFGNFRTYPTESGLYAGMFNGCTGGENQHLDLYFEGYGAPNLYILGSGTKFYFNMENWATDALETEHISIHVSEDMQAYYLDAWRYDLLGYDKNDTWNGSAYQRLWNAVRVDLFNASGTLPTDAEIMAATDKRLTDSENRARVMMGLPTVETTRKYELAVDPDTGDVTLTAAHNVMYVNLTAAELEMPDDWTLSYIGAGAFKDSPNLYGFALPETLKGIQNGAFEGMNSFTLSNLPEKPSCELLGFEEGTPFTFGIPDDTMHFDVYYITDDFDEDVEKEQAVIAEYIQAWTLPMAGYHTEDTMRAAVAARLRDEVGAEPTDDEVKNAMLEELLTAENRLHKMFGEVEIENPAEMVYRSELYGTADNSGENNADTPDTVSLFAMQTPETAMVVQEPPTPAQPETTPQPETVPQETPTPTPQPTETPAPEPTPTSPATPETAAEE